MPVPFGVSVGDFIAGIEFIHSVCEALEGTTGSKAQYQGVIQTLQSVLDALEQLCTIKASAEDGMAVIKIIDRIKGTLLRYDAKIEKYKASLGSCKTKKWRHALPRKVQWQRYSKEDILWFQNEIAQHLSSLQIILSKIQNIATFEVAQTTEGSLTRIEELVTQSAISLQAQSVSSEVIISSRLDECRLATVSGLQQTENTARQLHGESEAAAQARFEITLAVLMRIYRDIRRGMFLFYICVVNTINLVHQVLLRLPPRMLTQASTIFEDAHGFICHINTQFIQSWRAFNYVVRDNFRGRPGLLRVTTGKYRLHDRFGSSEINTLQSFASVFRPGRHIRQSILFDWNEVPLECCPKCKHRQAINVGTEVECNECGLWYRKLQSSGDQRSSEFNREASTRYQASESSSGDVPRTSKKTKVVKDLCRPQDFLRIAISAMPDFLESDTPDQHHFGANDRKVAQSEAKNRRIKKMILAEALQKANTALQLDNDQDYGGAVSAYFDACELLRTAMDRSSAAGDKEKLDAIRVTYANRIEELRSLPSGQVLKTDDLPVAGPSTAAKQIEGSRVNVSTTKQQEPLESVEDDSRDLLREHGREISHGPFTGGLADGYFKSIGSSRSWMPSTSVSTMDGKGAYSAKDNMTRVDLLDQMKEQEILAENHLQDWALPGSPALERFSPHLGPEFEFNPASSTSLRTASDLGSRASSQSVIDPGMSIIVENINPNSPDLLKIFQPDSLGHSYTDFYESTPKPTNPFPRYLEPKPDMAPPTPTLGRQGPLPTPQLTPLSLASMQERSAQRGASVQSSTISQRS